LFVALTVNPEGNSTKTSLAASQEHLTKINISDPPESGTASEARPITRIDSSREQQITEISPGPTTDLLPDGISNPHIGPYSADAFSAMTFCFSGFEDDMASIFGDCVQVAQ
jgi:hypothetical protein